VPKACAKRQSNNIFYAVKNKKEREKGAGLKVLLQQAF
jgi:hypothetical protein